MSLVREALEAGIAELTNLLEFPDVGEDEFQSWFERHPVVFDVLGYRRSISHPELTLPGSPTLIPDFIAQRPDGLWEIVELKRPDTAVLKNPERRTAFYSDMNTYVSQCLEYAERCSDSHVAQSLLEAHGFVINAQPESTLISGRSDGLDRLKVHGLLKRFTPKIRHYTFDDVLDALQQHYVSNFSGNTDGPGISIYSCICLLPRTSQSVEFLLDVGHSTSRNRISLTRFGDTHVTFSVVDDSGLRSSQDINIADHCDEGQFVCGVHVTHTSTSALVLFEVNGSYVGEYKLAKGSLALIHPLPSVVAADMEGQHSASMIRGTHMVRDPALTVVEREMVRKYLFNTIWPTCDEAVPRPAYGLRFSEGQFMYTEGHPLLDAAYPRTTNLVQRVDERRPTLTYWPALVKSID
ncbi:MAG: DUF4263 domain-containing protein [Sulfuricella sp.]|nr:DUF4263 domain-containing protein [Sulfuricella sp.]